MKNLLKSWTTQDLKETEAKYLNGLSHYRKGERQTTAFFTLKKKTELITEELKTR